jgi:hypothetical protein
VLQGHKQIFWGEKLCRVPTDAEFYAESKSVEKVAKKFIPKSS